MTVRCDLLVRGASEVVTMVPGAGQAAPAGPGASVDLGVIPRGAVAARDGRVVWTGPEAEIAAALEVPDDARVVDVEGAAVVPGFVDAHAHLVWAGERAAEYGARLGGATYLEIQEAGGGINSTVRATRAATEEQLAALAARRLDSFLRHGTTTLEAKTGYGLTLEDERKQLAAAKVPHPVRRVHTVLAAHLTPEEYAGRDDEYIALVCDEILPALAGQAEFVDVFCDEGAFTVAQSRRVLEAGRALGYRLKIHAEELAHTGGTALAASLGAVSADHLIHITGEDIAALKESGTVAVLLPGTSYTLHTTYAPAKELLAAGVTVALATDFNPGSCYSENLQMAISLACQEDRLTPAEALRAATMGGAAALGLQHEVGSLEPGKYLRPARPRLRDPSGTALPLGRQPRDRRRRRRRGRRARPPGRSRGPRIHHHLTGRRRSRVTLIECIPNFSEGRRQDVIDEIAAAVTRVDGVHLLDVQSDPTHNRCVVTFVGHEGPIAEAAFRAIETAAALIDLNRHAGAHPRFGATDVVPFVPLRSEEMPVCVEVAQVLAHRVAADLEIPAFLYEDAARIPEHKNLASSAGRGSRRCARSSAASPRRRPMRVRRACTRRRVPSPSARASRSSPST